MCLIFKARGVYAGERVFDKHNLLRICERNVLRSFSICVNSSGVMNNQSGEIQQAIEQLQSECDQLRAQVGAMVGGGLF
jgi:hypothetical protein